MTIFLYARAHWKVLPCRGRGAGRCKASGDNTQWLAEPGSRAHRVEEGGRGDRGCSAAGSAAPAGRAAHLTLATPDTQNQGHLDLGQVHVVPAGADGAGGGVSGARAPRRGGGGGGCCQRRCYVQRQCPSHCQPAHACWGARSCLGSLGNVDGHLVQESWGDVEAILNVVEALLGLQQKGTPATRQPAAAAQLPTGSWCTRAAAPQRLGRALTPARAGVADCQRNECGCGLEPRQRLGGGGGAPAAPRAPRRGGCPPRGGGVVCPRPIGGGGGGGPPRGPPPPPPPHKKNKLAPGSGSRWRS
jgi:hypothetical protein